MPQNTPCHCAAPKVVIIIAVIVIVVVVVVVVVVVPITSLTPGHRRKGNNTWYTNGIISTSGRTVVMFGVNCPWRRRRRRRSGGKGDIHM